MISWKCRRLPQPSSEFEDDEDVAEERERVLSGEADDDLVCLKNLTKVKKEQCLSNVTEVKLYPTRGHSRMHTSASGPAVTSASSKSSTTHFTPH